MSRHIESLTEGLRADLAEVTAERDHWIRLFNRLEVAVSHHKRDAGLFTEGHDETLYKYRDRILSDAHKGA